MDFNIDLGKVGLTWGGPWSPETGYERITLVTHEDAVYLSLKDSLGVEPGTDELSWSFLVRSGSGGEPIIQGDTMTVAYYEGKLYWKKNGAWMKDPDGNMVPVGAAAAEVITSDNDIELRYSSIASPGNPTDKPQYWDTAGGASTIWMAIRLKRNGTWGSWSILQTRGRDGHDGNDGADATSIGFKGSFSNPANLPATPETGDAYIFTGETTTYGGKTWTTGHLFVWDGDSWEDVGQIQGPPGQNNFVYVAFSDDNGVTLTDDDGTVPGKYFGTCVTSSSSRPTTASSYTWVRAQGEDGFGYEFIYKRTQTATAPAVPTSVDEDEYVPNGWADDQDDVTAEWKYCWQCYRMKKHGHWQNYVGSPSNPGYATLVARWGRDGEDGSDGTTPTTQYKSIVFTRSNSTPAPPTGGSYNDPIPEDVDGLGNPIWEDGIPEGQERVWSSSNIFHSDGTSDGWTTPQPMTDTDTYDVEFARMQTNDGNPAPPSSSNRHGGSGTQIWFDPDLDSSEDFTNMYWRAERHCINGEWGNWTIVRIKGEKGDAGTSITILGTKSSTSELPASDNTIGDSWLVGGNLYIWDGDSWENAGQLQGPPGDNGQTPFLHIKYGIKVNGNIIFTSNSGETPGDYIGIYWDYTSTDSASVDAYTWSYCKGKDGFGYEYIFTTTQEKVAPAIPTAESNPSTGKVFQDDDFVPAGWQDDMPDLNDTDKRYRWKCWRKKVDGVWGAFQGSSTNAGFAAFDGNYAKDGAMGIGISGVTEFYAISDDGVNPPNEWQTTVQTPTKAKKFLWNYEVISYSNGDGIPTTPCVIGVYGEGRGISAVTEKYLATTLSSGITRNSAGWTTAVQHVSATNPYLWNYEIITFDDNTTKETDPVVIGHFGADGTPGTIGIGIDHIEEYYAASASPADTPSSWGPVNTFPSDYGTNKPFLWNYERVYYTNGTYVDQPAVPIAHYGTDGDEGRGISDIQEFYLATDDPSPVNDVEADGSSVIGWTDGYNVPPISEAQPYMFNFERIVYTDGSYHDTTPVMIGIYTISALSTYAYLKAIFGEDNVSGQSGAILRNLLGVLDTNDNCVAMINASAIGFDSVHKKLMIAAGMTNVTNPGSAKFKVYEDGHVEMTDCKVRGEIEATSMKIADDAGNTKLRIGSDDFRIGSGQVVQDTTALRETVNSSTSSEYHTVKLCEITVPTNGGTRVYVPSFRVFLNPLGVGGSALSHSKVKFRMYLACNDTPIAFTDGGPDVDDPDDLAPSIEQNLIDWLYVGGVDFMDSHDESYPTPPHYPFIPPFALVNQTLVAGQKYSVYIKYAFLYESGDTGSAYIDAYSYNPMSITTIPAEQGFSLGNNGFQMSLGDGFFIRATNDNGNKEVFLSARCDDGTDAWISLSSRGIYIRNKGDNEERKL